MTGRSAKADRQCGTRAFSGVKRASASLVGKQGDEVCGRNPAASFAVVAPGSFTMPAGSKSYVAVDIDANGRSSIDQFTASNDMAVTRRAQFAAEGVALELWRGDQLLGRWVRLEKGTFAAVGTSTTAPFGVAWDTQIPAGIKMPPRNAAGRKPSM